MSHRIDDCELGDWDPGAESSGKRKEENRPLLESGPDSTDSLEGSADPHTDSLSNVDFNAKLSESPLMLLESRPSGDSQRNTLGIYRLHKLTENQGHNETLT